MVGQCIFPFWQQPGGFFGCQKLQVPDVFVQYVVMVGIFQQGAGNMQGHLFRIQTKLIEHQQYKIQQISRLVEFKGVVKYQPSLLKHSYLGIMPPDIQKNGVSIGRSQRMKTADQNAGQVPWLIAVGKILKLLRRRPNQVTIETAQLFVAVNHLLFAGLQQLEIF